jgi:hypothetical protein
MTVDEIAVLEVRIPKFRDVNGKEIALRPGEQEFIVTGTNPTVLTRIR